MIAQAAASRAGAASASTSARVIGLSSGPDRDLVCFGGERDEVVADDLDESSGGVRVGIRTEALELRPNPRREIARLRRLEREHLPGFPTAFASASLFGVSPSHERQDGSRHGVPQVLDHRLDVGLLPALDAFDDDKAAAVGPGKEAEGVAGRDRLRPVRRVRREVLDRLVSEARAEPAERADDLGPVASGQEIDRQERLAGHRGQA